MGFMERLAERYEDRIAAKAQQKRLDKHMREWSKQYKREHPMPSRFARKSYYAPAPQQTKLALTATEARWAADDAMWGDPVEFEVDPYDKRQISALRSTSAGRDLLIYGDNIAW